jgi:hypothetical protein
VGVLDLTLDDGGVLRDVASWHGEPLTLVKRERLRRVRTGAVELEVCACGGDGRCDVVPAPLTFRHERWLQRRATRKHGPAETKDAYQPEGLPNQEPILAVTLKEQSSSLARLLTSIFYLLSSDFCLLNSVFFFF